MSENVCQPNIPLIMGTVSGPVFGLFDISNIEEESFCQINLLRKVPIGLINLSQVIVIMRPDQVKRHQCSGNRCAFSQIDFANIPQVDYICRAWFPNEDSGCNQWPEASISIGGAMLAANHLREMTTEHDRTWTFAFWSPLTSTWEILGADSKTDLTGRVIVYRKDFSPAENIYARAKKSMPFSDIERKSNQLIDILNLSANNSNGSVNPLFAVTVVHVRKRRVGKLDNLGVNYFFVPFLPIFVGELQNVVLVGDFLREALLTKGRSKILALKPYSNFLGKLRHVLDMNETREKTLSYFGVVNSWKQKEILQEYPLKDTKCGWTFFRDEAFSDERVSGFPFQYLTIEPGVVAPPFGNSASGALACAVAQSLIYPNNTVCRKRFRGKTHNAEKPYGERFFVSSADSPGKYLSISKNQQDLWTIQASIKQCGYHIDSL